MPKKIITKDDLDRFPSLVEKGYKEGDEVDSEDFVPSEETNNDEDDTGGGIEVPKKPPPP